MIFGQITNVILKLVSPLISRTKTTESDNVISEPLIVDQKEIDNNKASDLLYDPGDEFPDWSEQELRAEEILRGTLFEGEVYLTDVLRRQLTDKHTVCINMGHLTEWWEDIEAYEISISDWSAIIRLIELDKELGDHEEGEEYSTKTFDKPEDIKVQHCYAGEYISANEEVELNCYSEDCDTYGTTAGSKAKKNYVFYITDEKKYAVVYFAYWCL
ncbi:putative Cilia- and flagella-associated protein 299 [Brevibacillus sp. IT-7CA2]|uniref:hypothetical protein n=1 Tax=Brevibacillus sp. IT-7CA2 TaxID=3026436 RepID=UPI0039E1F1A1